MQTLLSSNEAPPSPTSMSTSTISTKDHDDEEYERNQTNYGINLDTDNNDKILVMNGADDMIRSVNIDHVRSVLGNGSCRFAVDGRIERTVQQQIKYLTMEEKMCYDNLKCKWEEIYKPFNDYMYLRFARCSPGPVKFNEHSAWKVMLQYNRKYDTNRCSDPNNYIEKQLLTKTIFPLPYVKTLEGEYDMLYFRPSRYHPSKKYEHIVDPRNNHEVILENLVYVINSMVEKERSCTEGVGMLIYMNDWIQKTNFTTQYFFQFLQVLQGATVPVRVRLCLFVNPPDWFQKVWPVMRLVLSKELRQMIHLVNENQLGQYLKKGYESFLPADMDSGVVPTYDIVNDYILFRKYVENLNQQHGKHLLVLL